MEQLYELYLSYVKEKQKLNKKFYKKADKLLLHKTIEYISSDCFLANNKRVSSIVRKTHFDNCPMYVSTVRGDKVLISDILNIT